jgi:DNA-binding NarL/FixJ family response regulator
MTVKTVMLVDDSRFARMMIRATIQKAYPSWLIVEAANGEEALALASTSLPDYVLMDVNMPGIGGVETARQLLASCPGAAITLVTANIQDAVRHQADDIGIGFIAKPIREDMLLQFLRGTHGAS